MRGIVPEFNLVKPASLAETLQLLSKEPKRWKLFAGGTDIMVVLEAGQLKHKEYLTINHLKELQGIAITNEHVTLGALTTYGEIQQNDILKKEFPLLCEAARETGAIAIQNRGTLGGNIANASPAADSPPALLVYGAELELVSTRGSRWVPYETFHTGYKQFILGPDEIIAKIKIPRTTAGTFQLYRKVGTRKAQAISKVCFAGLAKVEKGTLQSIRIAMGSVAPVPLLLTKTLDLLANQKLDDTLISKAKAQASKEVAPINDIRSTQEYRQTVTANLVESFLKQVMNVGLDK